MKKIGVWLDRVLWRIPVAIPFHEQSRRLATDCAELRIRDSEKGSRALVFLCDPPMTVEAYDDLINILAPEFRVVIIELPGFGFSRALSVNVLDFPGTVESVESAISLLQLEQFALFGPCICGFVASEICNRGNLPVRGLVLMQTPDKEGMLAWVGRMDPKGILRVPMLGQLIVRITALKTAQFWLRYATAKTFDASSLVTSVLGALKQGSGFPLATMLQRWSMGTANAALQLPTMIIWGKQDRSHANTNPESALKHAEAGEIIEFPDCGHFTELEKPQEFVKSVLPFLNKCLGSGDA